MEKKTIINALFLLTFPFFGIGSYISAAKSPSSGFIFATAPFVLILIFYVVDLLYRRRFRFRVNALYLLMTIFLLSGAYSLFVSLSRNLPETTMAIVVTKSLLIVVPFQAFVAVQLYNDDKDALANLTFLSLTVLLLINLFGYFVLGISNKLHNIEGRINFPFLDGLYSGSCLVAVLNIMLLWWFRKMRNNVLWLAGFSVYVAVNLVILLAINSRLTILILLLVSAMIVFRLGERLKLTYYVSLFTIPILLSSGIFLYHILNLPVFRSLFKRVALVDVTTFNGRAFLWKDAMDWMFYDREGLLFGNGYRGHYFLNLLSDVAKMWNEDASHHLHLHSTSLEILLGQGLLALCLFLFVVYKLYGFYATAAARNSPIGVFFGVVIFLMFILQVDTFVYLENLGAVILAWLASFAVMRTEPEAGRNMY